MDTQNHPTLQMTHTSLFSSVLLFKNWIKSKWHIDPDQSTLQSDKKVFDHPTRTYIRENILKIMIKSEKNIQLQLCEVVAEIAKYDFPSQWPSLPQVIFLSLNVLT